MNDPASLADVLARLRSCEWIDLTNAFGPGITHLDISQPFGR